MRDIFFMSHNDSLSYLEHHKIISKSSQYLMKTGIIFAPLSTTYKIYFSHFDLETIHNVLYVWAGESLSKAELFSKVDLVIKLMKLLQKFLLRDRTV